MLELYHHGSSACADKLFPDGSKIVKIEWSFKKNTVAPYFVMVPGHPESGCDNRKRYQEIPGHARMGVRQF